MRRFIVSILLILIGFAVCEKYTSKFDNIDIDEVLKSDRLLKNYFDCVMGRGKCTADGQELKDHIAEGLQTDCEKCTEKQKTGTVKVIKFLVKNKRPMFDELTAKFDPEGIYRTKHKDDFTKEGITL